jgi:aminopeptidase N
MKYIYYFLAFLVLPITSSLMAQKSEALLTQYQHEYETFKEFIIKNEAYKGDTNIDVKFYHIDIEIGINSPWIEGSVLCRFTPLIDGLSELYIDLNSALQVDSISSPCSSFTQGGDAINIQLDGSYNTGDLVDLTIYYHGVPASAGIYKKGLRYETHGSNEPIIATLSTPYLAHYWYPCKDGPEDKPDSVFMDITIPDTTIMGVELMAISNGVLENVVSIDNKKTFQWRHRYPIVTYYVMAAISNYIHFQHEFNGTGGESFPLDYYVFEDHVNEAQQGIEQLPEAIQFFSDVFGPYPFREEKYGMTQLGFYGAIENQTNTIQNNLSISWFEVSVHELGHMWFGDMITLADWHHSWLNEGFATYSEALWAEHLGGFDAYKSNMTDNEFWFGGTLYLENAADTFNTFPNIVYNKGAYAVHMLRGVLGDNVFFDALLDYSGDPNFMYKNADTEDMQESFENSSGLDLAYFFEQWIYDEYFPLYHYNYSQTSDNNFTLAIYQAQEELYDRRPVFTMPVRIKLNFENGGDTIVNVWNDLQIQNFSFNLSDEVSSVEFDPDKWILHQAEYNPDLPVVIVDSKNDGSISIYPNPFHNKLTIYLDQNKIGSDIQYSIYSVNGQLIKESVIKDGNQTIIETSQYPAGLYYIHISENGKKGVWQKVIKY